MSSLLKPMFQVSLIDIFLFLWVNYFITLAVRVRMWIVSLYIWLDLLKPCQYFEPIHITHIQFDFMTLKGLLKKRSKRWCFLACFAVQTKKDFTRFSSKHIILLYSVLLYRTGWCSVCQYFRYLELLSFYFFGSIILLPLLLEFESE